MLIKIADAQNWSKKTYNNAVSALRRAFAFGWRSHSGCEVSLLPLGTDFEATRDPLPQALCRAPYVRELEPDAGSQSTVGRQRAWPPYHYDVDRLCRMDRGCRTIPLGGSMKPYAWSMDGEMWPHITPLMVKQGQRVEFELVNRTMMAA
jgi:hypothetical protein